MRQDIVDLWRSGDEGRCPFCGELYDYEELDKDEDFTKGHRVFLYCECQACGERFGVEYQVKSIDVFE